MELGQILLPLPGVAQLLQGVALLLVRVALPQVTPMGPSWTSYTTFGDPWLRPT